LANTFARLAFLAPLAAACAEPIPDSKLFAGAGILHVTNQEITVSAKRCKYEATLRNQSEASLGYLELSIKANGITFPVRPVPIPANSSVRVAADCGELRMPLTGRVASRYVRALVMRDGQSDGDVFRAMHFYAETLPALAGPFVALLVSDDVKCARDYKLATEEGGVAGRKKFQEMLLVGCGKAVNADSRVRVLAEEGEFLKVESVGEQPVVGWVHRVFVKGQ